MFLKLLQVINLELAMNTGPRIIAQHWWCVDLIGFFPAYTKGESDSNNQKWWNPCKFCVLTR